MANWQVLALMLAFVLGFFWLLRKVKGTKKSYGKAKSKAKEQEKMNTEEWLQIAKKGAMPGTGLSLVLTALEKGTAETAGGQTVDLVQMVGDLTAEGTQLASLQSGLEILRQLNDMGASVEEATEVFRALKTDRANPWTTPASGGTQQGKSKVRTPNNPWGVES